MYKTKCLVLLLASILITSSMTMVGLASAQSTPQVPKFSLNFTDHSYEMNSRHMRNGTIQITIENQPFTPYKDANNNTIRLFYHYQIKSHYDSKWIISPWDDQYIYASDTDKTILEYPIKDYWEDASGRVVNIPADGKLDFQIEAFIGYAVTLCASIAMRAEDYYTLFNGQTSGWSDTQTITVGQGNAQSTPNPTLNPIQPNPTTAMPTQKTAPTQQIMEIHLVFGELNWEQTAIILLGIAVIGLTVGLLVLYRKTQKISANRAA